MAQQIPFSFFGQGETFASVEISPLVRTNVQATNLDITCNATDEGGAPITDKGVCWSVNPNPTIDDNFLSSGFVGVGPFTVPITDTEGLNLITVYYFRAYVTNTYGTAYSSQKIQPTSVAPFLTEWNLPTPGETIDIFNRSFTFGSPGPYTIDAYVNWGDGSAIEYFSGNTQTLDIGNIVHTYATSGIKNVKVSGIFPQIYISNESRLETVEEWGGQAWRCLERAFRDSTNVDITATDSINLSNIDLSSNQLYQMFRSCTSLVGTPAFNNWDVSSLTDISFMFYGCNSFDQDISSWDVSNIEEMDYLFNGCTIFNQDISGWNVSSVTNMNRAFGYTNMIGLDLSSWDVSNVENMSQLFTAALHVPSGISGWNVSSVTNFGNAFGSTSPAVIPDITSWDTSNATTLSSMFISSTFNQDISGWTLNPALTSLYSMFSFGTPFNQDITGWNVSNITDFSQIFRDNTAINQDFSTWDISSATTLWRMFDNVTTLSTANYDAMLIAWEALGPPINLSTHFGTTQYTKAPSAAATAHASLLSTYNWTIIDGGPTP